MKLQDFIRKLEEILKKHGKNASVVMADNLAIVNPAFLKDDTGNKVVITDQE